MKSIVDHYLSYPSKITDMVSSLREEEREEVSKHWEKFLKASYYCITSEESPTGKCMYKRQYVDYIIKRVRTERGRVPYNRFQILDLDG